MNAPWYDINATRALPRVVEVDVGVLPEPWAKFCRKNKIRLFTVIGYENEIRGIKIWPAGNIIARGIERGEHLKTDTMVESTSGKFGEGEAEVVTQLRAMKADFPLKRVIAVVPRSLQPGKLARLRAYECVELAFADNATDAMMLAAKFAEAHGYWYTQQYWNPDNSAAYARMAVEITKQLPTLAIWNCGVGSGGTFDGTVPVMREAFKDRKHPSRLFCSAVAVMRGQSVGGVRTEVGLDLPGKPGLKWRLRADDVNYVGLPHSLKFSAALWQQCPDDPARRIIGGESTGFALAGGLLAALKLEAMDELDSLRDESGEIVMAFPAPDTREAYREDYEAHGILLPSGFEE